MGLATTSCFLNEISRLERGGADLVAESESLFSREVFVLHYMDVKFLQDLLEALNTGPFLIMLIGIPGVGKTELLLTLLRNESQVPDSIKENSVWRAIRQKCNFMDFGHPISAARDSAKANVWIVPTVDEYYSPSSEDHIGGLLRNISKFMRPSDSIILAGNQGMFSIHAGGRDPRDKIREAVADRTKNRGLNPLIRDPWIKEYGGNPHSQDGLECFKDFALQLLEFVKDQITECSKRCCNPGGRELCKNLQTSTEEALKLLEKGPFAERIYDLVCSVRLRHRDVFLTPRTLLVFWADFLSNLLQPMSNDHKEEVYRCVLDSCLISSVYSQSYRLNETNVDIVRSKELDALLSKKYSNVLKNCLKRRSARMRVYFEGEIEDPRKMIYEGAYKDFIEEHESSEVLKKVFRYFFVYADKRFQRKMENLDNIIDSGEWLLYTFLTECWTKNKKEFVTNMGAVEDFIDKYTPVLTKPIDFQEKRSRDVSLNMKLNHAVTPQFNVDLETFLPFRMLGQGFYVDFSMYPSILAKIERVLSESKDIFRPYLLRWLKEHVADAERMAHTYISKDGNLMREEKAWS